MLTSAYGAGEENADDGPSEQDAHGERADGGVVVEDVAEGGLVALVGAGPDDDVDGGDGPDDGPDGPADDDIDDPRLTV